MHERPPQQPIETSPEKGPERFPSKEEVTSVFEALLKGGAYKELRALHDEQGVAVYEIETTNEQGERIEYNFQKAKNDYRDPSLPKSAQYSASIHTLIFDGDMPTGGECVANYLDGEWTYPV